MSLLNWFSKKNSQSSEKTSEQSQKRTPNHTFTDEDREHAAMVRRAKCQTTVLEEQQKQEKLRYQHMLDMEDLKNKAIETRAERLQMRKAMFGDEEEDDEDDSDNILVNLLTKVVSNYAQPQLPPAPAVQVSLQSETAGASISDDDIAQFLEAIPKPAMKQLKKLDDETLAKQIQAQVPGISTPDVRKAINAIRNYQ